MFAGKMKRLELGMLKTLVILHRFSTDFLAPKYYIHKLYVSAGKLQNNFIRKSCLENVGEIDTLSLSFSVCVSFSLPLVISYLPLLSQCIWKFKPNFLSKSNYNYESKISTLWSKVFPHLKRSPRLQRLH